MNPVVVVLATQRLTQLVTEDELTRPLRDAIDSWATGAAEFTVKDRVATLTGCSACVSVWAGAGILLASRWRVGRVLVRILAASGAALIVDAGRQRLER